MRRLVLTSLGALAFAACGGSAKKTAEVSMGASNEPGGLQVPDVDAKTCDPSGKEVTTSDLNRDNRADVWKLFEKVDQKGTTVSVLTCKQVDFNYDGKKDFVGRYDATGAILVEEYDFDFDGKIDARFHYDKATGKRYFVERDSGFDQAPDIWEKYDKDERVETIQRDRNGDTKPDYWEQYNAGTLQTILFDDDFDGKVDRQEQGGAGTPGTGPGPTPPSPSPAGEAAPSAAAQ
jgi:hypothetical protein